MTNWEIKKEIFVINHLANVMPEAIFYENGFSKYSKEVFAYYQEQFSNLEMQLIAASIEYRSLKSALVPPEKGKNEVVYVFDSCMIASNQGYILHIVESMMPILKTWKQSTYSILGGDLPYHPITPIVLINELEHRNQFTNNTTFFAIYFNKLTNKQMKQLCSFFDKKPYYCGYKVLNADSRLKDLISRDLVQIALVHKNSIIVDGAPEDCSMTNNPFFNSFCSGDDHFDGVIVDDQLYGIFLTYRIGSTIVDDKNPELSINSVTSVEPNTNLSRLLIVDSKLDYLKECGETEHKHGKDEKWSEIFQREDYTVDNLRELIEKLTLTNIYNLRLKGPKDGEAEELDFNIIGSVAASDGQPFTIRIALGMELRTGQLKFITGY